MQQFCAYVWCINMVKRERSDAIYCSKKCAHRQFNFTHRPQRSWTSLKCYYNHRDIRLARRRELYGPEKKEYNRRYAQEHKEERRMRDRLYTAMNRTKINMAELARCHNLRLEAELKVGRGERKCSQCGIIDCKFFINHNRGDGKRDRNIYRNSSSFHRAIRDGLRPIDDLSLLCRPCHNHFHIKGILV